MCIIAVCVFASCNKKPQEHVHEYGEWAVVREATCESDGLKERACNGCDQTEQETIAALGHSYGEWVAEASATCTTAGKKGHYECSVYDCLKKYDYVSPSTLQYNLDTDYFVSCKIFDALVNMGIIDNSDPNDRFKVVKHNIDLLIPYIKMNTDEPASKTSIT